MKSCFFFSLAFLTAQLSFCQAPTKLWEAFYDGALTGKDQARSVVMDSSGNAFVTGTSYQSVNGGNFTTILYDANGNQLWADHYNGTQQSGFNGGVKLVMDKWGNVYAIGTVSTNSGDLAIAKYTTNGLLWIKNYEPYWFGSDVDYGKDIAVDSSGNLYSLGQMTSLNGELWDLLILKTDSAGNEIYKQNYSSASGDDWPAGIDVTPAGNMFALASCFNFFGSGTYDITTINYIGNGVQNWFSRYDGPGGGLDYGTKIKVDANDNQYVCGTAEGLGGSDDLVAMKQNLYGTRLWTVTYNGSANGNDTAVAINYLNNGLVAVSSRTKENHNSTQMNSITTMLIDSGTVLWIDNYYGTADAGAIPTCMLVDEFGNIYVAGYETTADNTKDGVILKYDSNGNLLWHVEFNSINNLDDRFNSMAFDDSLNIMVTGQSYSSSANADFITVKYKQEEVFTSLPATSSLSPVQLNVFPNPLINGQALNFSVDQDLINCTLKIIDVRGTSVAQVKKDKFSQGFNSFPLQTKLSPGIYFLNIFSDQSGATKKIVVL